MSSMQIKEVYQRWIKVTSHLAAVAVADIFLGGRGAYQQSM